ncbi:hypothetical protein L1277_002757 [Okibacterium sp. HSC-33S16]|uniref:CoA transferase n=1 Tax=Okibacterium sp. HSC-33S16 TaxID=2910965 RepID=UPI00209DFAA1|nr:CoA transferase [Okibacterium sp. HSC-33S16]MCP2032647.1 hypothetical protein [Okibacterium sp. HSC-33S16]
MSQPDRQDEDGVLQRMLDAILGSEHARNVAVSGSGSLRSVFPVTELATASIAAAGVALNELLDSAGFGSRTVNVDRRLASLWFGTSIRPRGWELPPAWDAVAGDYEAADGWIRLHTNAPAHREVALRVLGVRADRKAVGAAVARWNANKLEAAIVEAGGCAAVMHSLADWHASEPGRAVATEPLIGWENGGMDGGAMNARFGPQHPLEGIRVLDLTRVLAGPVTTRFLAMLGADVLRIDPPEWDEPGVVPDVLLGKRTARLDLRQSSGRNRLLELLASADMLVQGYRPGALDNLGLDASVRDRARPGLIEISLDAYGWTGPWAGRRGFDSLVQMSSGIADAGMHAFGLNKPGPLPVQALDHATGYLMAHAALMALRTRDAELERPCLWRGPRNCLSTQARLSSRLVSPFG